MGRFLTLDLKDLKSAAIQRRKLLLKLQTDALLDYRRPPGRISVFHHFFYFFLVVVFLHFLYECECDGWMKHFHRRGRNSHSESICCMNSLCLAADESLWYLKGRVHPKIFIMSPLACSRRRHHFAAHELKTNKTNI